MKKIIPFTLVLLVLLSCLTACSMTQSASGDIAGEAESTPKVEEMMAALADDNTSNAKALLHPQIAETSDPAIAQMSAYLMGRNVSSIELININITTSAGTTTPTRQERVGYQVTLNDGAVIYINAIYLSNKEGAGFAAFQLVLGVV